VGSALAPDLTQALKSLNQRHFETTLDKNGKIQTAAMVGGGNMMDVIGVVGDKESKIKLEGYCKFEGELTKKQ